VVNQSARAEASFAPELVQRHTGVAGDLDPAHPRLRSGGHFESDVDQLFVGLPGQIVEDDWLVKSVIRQGLVHLSHGPVQSLGGKTRSGIQAAGSFQLRVHRWAFGAIDRDGSDEGAGCSSEHEGNATFLSSTVRLNCLEQAGREKLMEALGHIFAAQWRSDSLGEFAGQGRESIRRNAFNGNPPYRKSLPLGRDGLRCARGSVAGDGWGLGT
jgi:hypothetical protein